MDHVSRLLNELGMPQYLACFEEEELTEVSLLRNIGRRPDALRTILKEIGVSKIGHRERLVNAVLASGAETAGDGDDGDNSTDAGSSGTDASPEGVKALATRQALGLSRGIVTGGLALSAIAQKPAWRETPPPDDEEEADALAHLDLRLGSVVAARLASSLGSVAAQQAKVRALLQNGWIPRLVSTLSAAVEAAAEELMRAQAERTSAEASRDAERAAAAADAEAAGQAGVTAEFHESKGPRVVASIDDVDDFEVQDNGRGDDKAAIMPSRRSGMPAPITVLLKESTSNGNVGARSWRIGAERHWSLAELRSAASAPDLLGAAPFRFCSPTAATEHIDPNDESTVPLSVMRVPVLVVLGPLPAAHQQISPDALSEVVSTRLAAAVVVRRQVGIPARPRWIVPAVVGEPHPSVEGHTATQTSDGTIWIFGGIEAGVKKSGLRSERTYTAAVASLSSRRMRREGRDDTEVSFEWNWPEISLPRITHVVEPDSDDDTGDVHVAGGVDAPSSSEKKVVVELGEAPSPRAGHCATLIEEDDSVLYFGGTAAGPNSTMAFQHMLLYNEVVILDTRERSWVRPRVEGEPPRGRSDLSAWRLPRKPRLLITLGERCLDSDKVYVLEWERGVTPGKADALTWSRVHQTSGVPPYPSFHPTAVSGHSTTPLPRGHRGGGDAVGGSGGGVVVLGGCTDPHSSQRDPLIGSVFDAKQMHWARLKCAGTPPYARYAHSATLLGGNEAVEPFLSVSESAASRKNGKQCQDAGVLLVVGGHCRSTCHRDSFVLDFGLSPPAWKQLRAENSPPVLTGHTATVLLDDECSTMLFVGGPEEGICCLENATPRSLRAWSMDATGRAIDLRPTFSRADDEMGAGDGEADGDINWRQALERLDGLEVVTAEDIPRLPEAVSADAAILGIPPQQPGGLQDAGTEAAAAAAVARKKAFRKAILTWHPDVMMRRLAGRLAADSYEAAHAIVTSNSIRVLEAAERLDAA